MGAAYNVISVGTVREHPFAIECLQSNNMYPAAADRQSRNPTPQELRTVLDALSGYSTEYLVTKTNWQASVEARGGFWLLRSSTLVNVVEYDGEETSPCMVTFEKGNPELIIQIVEQLSRLCGPLFIFSDTGARPLLVRPGVDPAEAIKVWDVF